MTNRYASSLLRRRRVRCACCSLMNQVHHLLNSRERMDLPGGVPSTNNPHRKLTRASERNFIPQTFESFGRESALVFLREPGFQLEKVWHKCYREVRSEEH